MNELIHLPVLKNEVIQAWKNQGNGIFVDCTFGRGGHSKALLAELSPNSRLIGLDIDPAAVVVGNQLQTADPRFMIVQNNFRNLQVTLSKLQIQKVDGILFDFGVSSPQLDDPNRGFSYHHDGPLDMRMDLNQSETAASLLAKIKVGELARIFEIYGECDESLKVARAILKHQQQQPITRTLELVEIIKTTVAKKNLYAKKHPCRTYFQALRIYLNQELDSIKLVLEQLNDVLNKNGIVVFLTFHSLEEKIIKKWIKSQTGYLDLPNLPIQIPKAFHLITKKSIRPSAAEIATNNRARSTKMWVIQKNDHET
ncbi:16S rRNA (cytosine1402-N4)-methyltransferase [Mycoplasmoides fastidiosum]|uniref:Ribosomal RNA small subunit methyltransferase H n=1 Tax=Mycoplasmoides fastidiosum TaxID=92758 RepID=A0ABU0LZY4_9BACT|nr:16S rRNA (cytosine(1402)-N(4))-methyltransferase RsmH [Mycoplasmoides fastidiosum]MDQ0514265.1 16S rRNA (cytosine1402-N4)-methyltransferase [Mycoplasmoides fastidiosum]UUD37327.1 16S rRNA (cytosine(1402)-N(4))-methyltransferase RsmH [Mycoplasmoides fastidiosum]